MRDYQVRLFVQILSYYETSEDIISKGCCVFKGTSIKKYQYIIVIVVSPCPRALCHIVTNLEVL